MRKLLLAALFAPALHAQAVDPKFDAIAALTDAKMKEFIVPGVAVGILLNGTATIRGFGITNVEDPLPVNAHTVFPIASISKTIAATAMMRLVEAGKVNLRSSVVSYIPEFKVRDADVTKSVSVWHLLTHLGGWEGQVSGPDRGSETLTNFVTIQQDLMQVAPPGAAWSYNNAGWSYAGRLIEKVNNASINNSIRDLVFRPLGLEHAGTHSNDFIVNRFAAGHTVRNGAAALGRPFGASVSVTAGGVGLDMTDMMAYAKFHMGDGKSASGEQILTKASLDQMKAPQMKKQSTDDEMGLGWHIRTINGVRTYSHGGTLGGHILLLEIVPERNFAISILTNANTGWRLIQDVEREALKSYLGLTYAKNQGIAHRGLVETLPNVEPLAQQPDAAQYAGTYARPQNTVIVRAEAGKVFVREGPAPGAAPAAGGGRGNQNPEWQLGFFGPDRAVIVSEGNDKGQAIEFVRDAAGKVGWVRVVGRVAVRQP
jgi:CubicO group peptidase (beta-lactamase class C family)